MAIIKAFARPALFTTPLMVMFCSIVFLKVRSSPLIWARAAWVTGCAARDSASWLLNLRSIRSYWSRSKDLYGLLNDEKFGGGWDGNLLARFVIAEL